MNRNTETTACAGLCPCVSPCPIGEALRVIGGKWKMRIICTLYVDGTQRYNDLVRKTSGVTNAMLSSSLKELEADGIVTRRQSEEDRRQTIVSLTEAGVARVEAFREFQRRHAEEFLAPLSIEERKMFASLLARLTGPREKDGGAEDDREEKPDGAVNSDGDTGRSER